jgi:predicted metal-dependent hydrolase
LNAKLLFLPPELVDYVMIHELSHLAEMNHSKRFWALVERHDPRFRILDRQLRDMWKEVPRWAS